MFETDRLKGALRVIVQTIFARLDYFANYPAKVISQDGAGSLDLEPDDKRVPAMSRIPIRYGIPGVKVKVDPGARVMIGWENGDPRRPYAALFETKGLKLLTFNDGTQRVARVGDVVHIPFTSAPGTPSYGVIRGPGQPKVEA